MKSLNEPRGSPGARSEVFQRGTGIPPGQEMKSFNKARESPGAGKGWLVELRESDLAESMTVARHADISNAIANLTALLDTQVGSQGLLSPVV